MANQKLAQIFFAIAAFLAMEEVPFKPRAYERAGQTLESLREDIEVIYKKGGINGLIKLPGIGRSIAGKIEEYLQTEKIKYYDNLRKKIPVEINELLAIEGVGPKMIKIFYQKLKIKNFKDLEKAARSGKIRSLPHFKKKTEDNILRGINFLKTSKGRHLLGNVLTLAREIETRLRQVAGVKHAAIAGSIRRRRATIGDFDFIATTSQPDKLMDFFVKMPEVTHIYDKGKSFSSVKLKNGMDADLRAVQDKNYGAILHHFTGDKYHNIALRKLAKARGLKISEYGLSKGKKVLASKTEKDIYKALGLPYIEPEMRENNGEIELARKKALPKLLAYGDIKGDLQMHTKWSDGANTILQMAKQAKKIGLSYIAITDHWRATPFGGTLHAKNYGKYLQEIKSVNKKIAGLRVLAGTEVDILEDGGLAAPDKYLKKFEIVLAGAHSHFHLSRAQQTKRLLQAIKNPYVNIIVHPTGRILKRREGVELNWLQIFKAVQKNKTVLEINAFPDRLDLSDKNIRQAVKNKVKLIINTDSHSVKHLFNMEFGIAQARRGWAEKKDIVNTKTLAAFLKRLRKS